jgi:hypothetical protein
MVAGNIVCGVKVKNQKRKKQIILKKNQLVFTLI